MAPTLKSLVHEHEVRRFGSSPRDLRGQPYVKSHLNRWLQDPSSSAPDFTTLKAGDIIHFLNQEFLRDPSATAVLIEDLMTFFDDLGVHQPSLSPSAKMISKVIQNHRGELDRRHKIERRFGELRNAWIYVPGPSESLETIDWEEKGLSLQVPPTEDRETNTYTLISRDRPRSLAYLRGGEDASPIVLKFEPTLLKLLEEGDRIPMTIAKVSDTHFVLLEASPPLLDTTT